jgi:hypothetical protein
MEISEEDDIEEEELNLVQEGKEKMIVHKNTSKLKARTCLRLKENLPLTARAALPITAAPVEAPDERRSRNIAPSPQTRAMPSSPPNPPAPHHGMLTRAMLAGRAVAAVIAPAPRPTRHRPSL